MLFNGLFYFIEILTAILKLNLELVILFFLIKEWAKELSYEESQI